MLKRLTHLEYFPPVTSTWTQRSRERPQICELLVATEQLPCLSSRPPQHILRHPRDGLNSSECCEFFRERNQNSQGPGKWEAGQEALWEVPGNRAHKPESEESPRIPGPRAQQQQQQGPRHLGPGVAETPALGRQHMATPCSDPLTSVESECPAGKTYLRSSWRQAWS